MALRVLIIHQNFPAQFKHLVEDLADDPAVELVGIGMNSFGRSGVRYRQYQIPVLPKNSTDIGIDDFLVRAWRAAAIAAQIRVLKHDGFVPDVIIVHSGWGEALYLRDVAPHARIINYCEYYYRRTGSDIDFDPEFQLASLDVLHRLRIRNAVELASIDDADLCVSPTQWQRSTYPDSVQHKIEVVHDGIDLVALKPDQRVTRTIAAGVPAVSPQEQVVTYMARHLEPVRGFHVFMRSLPELLAQWPKLRVVILGSETGGYGSGPRRGGTWKAAMLEELRGQLDTSRVHFVGLLSYDDYLNALRLSNVHVYLTYPFVLSWSALEAMALRCAIVGSRTPPVTEFIEHERTGLLVDFFDTKSLCGAVNSILDGNVDGRRLGAAARDSLKERKVTRPDAVRQWRKLLFGTRA